MRGIKQKLLHLHRLINILKTKNNSGYNKLEKINETRSW